MFNTQLLHQDVARVGAEALASVSELTAAKRELGLSYIVEVQAGQSLADVQKVFSDIHPAFEVEALFPAPLFPAVSESYAEPFPLYSSGYVARIPGIAHEDLQQNAFDLAYYAKAQGNFVSVMPDIARESQEGDEKSSGGNGDCEGSHCRVWALQKMHVPQAWAEGGVQGEGIHIAHIDTGWTPHYKWGSGGLAERLGYNFVENNQNSRDTLLQGRTLNPGHGTHTASVMTFRGGIAGDNCDTVPSNQVTGVAPKAWNVPIRAVTSVILYPTQTSVARAIVFAVQRGMPVISMSLGGFLLQGNLVDPIRFANEQQRIVLAASGNSVPGRFTSEPAAYGNVIGVAGSTPDDKPWGESGRVPYGSVNISAPGHCVWMGVAAAPGRPNNLYAKSSGTSYATANMAGVAALWLSKWYPTGFNGPTGTTANATFREHLRKTARKPADWNDWFGPGIVDAHKLLTTAPVPQAGAAESDLAEDQKSPIAQALLSTDEAAKRFISDILGEGAIAFEAELASIIANDPELREALCAGLGSIESEPGKNYKAMLKSTLVSSASKSLKAAIRS